MKKFFLLYIFVVTEICAQDAQFTQFYAAPLYHNPAFAGSANAPRIILNYRNQWPSLNANFITQLVSVDHFLEKINSGIGIVLLNDNQGNNIVRNEVSGLYSYQLKLNAENHLRLGLQGSYGQLQINKAGLIFGDQLGNTGVIPNQMSSDPLAGSDVKKPLFDVGTGALFYNSKSFAGLGVSHISQYGGIARKYMLHGGLNISLNHLMQTTPGTEREFTVSPNFLYKKQGKFSQLDFGAYATYTPLTVGLWYRGLPLKGLITKFPNQDAIAALVGFRFDNFSIGYSYDLTTSGLGVSTGGSHEFSISYQLDRFERDKTPYLKQRKKELSCPKF